MNWLTNADVIIAEVTRPSLGVGYEIAKAEQLGKPILCIYRNIEGRRLSAMISGNKYLTRKQYKSVKELEKVFERFLSTEK